MSNRDALTSGHPKSEWLLVATWTAVWWMPVLVRDVCGTFHPFRILDSSVVRINGGLAIFLWLILSFFLVVVAVIGARLSGRARGNLLASIAALEVGALVWAAPWVAHGVRWAGVPRSLTSVFSVAIGCTVALSLVIPAARLFHRVQFARLFGSIGAAAIAIWLYQGQAKSEIWLIIGVVVSAWALWLPQRISLFTASTGTAVSLVLAISVVKLPVSPPPSVDSADLKPHVVILLIDTLRADHLEIYGHGISTSPVLKQRLIGGVTVFTDATAGASSTIPSVKSLFSGRASTAWGLNEWGRPPPLNTWTLPRAFHEAGYTTCGISANGLLNAPGFTQGFDRFWSAGGYSWFKDSFLLGTLLSAGDPRDMMRKVRALRSHKEPGESINQKIESFVQERPADRPLFLYVHYVEPHWPYYDRGHGLIPEDTRGIEPWSYVDLLDLPKGDTSNVLLRKDPAYKELVGRYNEEIRHMDCLLDHLFRILEDSVILDDALIFILADHGEEFFEHGGFSHGHDVHQEQVHVPLVILWPKWLGQEAPVQINDPVSLVDLLPTLSELLDLPTSDENMSGISLLPLLRGETSHTRPVAEVVYGGTYRAAYREGSYKVRFVLDSTASPRDTGEIEVFDLRSDPAELHPLLLEGEVAAIASRAREVLQARWQDSPDRVARKDVPEIDDETIEQLRVLGYVD